MITPKQERGYIASLRRDPRTKAMFDGWVAQATQEADMRFPDPRDDREKAHFAARRALELAMSHVLDNDGELQMVMEQRDQLLDKAIEAARMMPPPQIIRVDTTLQTLGAEGKVIVPLADLALVVELAECPANPTSDHLAATERMRALVGENAS